MNQVIVNNVPIGFGSSAFYGPYIDPNEILRILAIVAVAVAAFPAAALGKNPPHPSGLNQPLKDGCQRQDFSIGFGTRPLFAKAA